MVAEELYKLLIKDIRTIVFEAVNKSSDRLLSTKEVAELLGWSVGTVYNKSRELPHTKAGKKLIFSEAAIRDWLFMQDSIIR
jgi:excisionase family DNA binding protein